MSTVIFWGSGAPCLMAQHTTFMSHILSYTGYAVAPRKQRQALATLWRGVQGRHPLMGTAWPRVRNLVTRPDSAHGISQLGYREPLESSVSVCESVCKGRVCACACVVPLSSTPYRAPQHRLGPMRGRVSAARLAWPETSCAISRPPSSNVAAEVWAADGRRLAGGSASGAW